MNIYYGIDLCYFSEYDGLYEMQTCFFLLLQNDFGQCIYTKYEILIKCVNTGTYNRPIEKRKLRKSRIQIYMA